MLYVVGTPIGNLKDISERAREVLKSVNIVACEDTRHSAILLREIGSDVKTISFHAHSQDLKLRSIINLLLEGKDVALISDAGTPGVADPGGVLVEEALKSGVIVSPIPGASSVIAALSVSGMTADQFRFLGFLPKKKGRETLFKSLIDEKMTSVFFESPNRIKKSVADLNRFLDGNRHICVCRELTKKFEEIWVGTLLEAGESSIREQGEFVIVLEGYQTSHSGERSESRIVNLDDSGQAGMTIRDRG